MGYKIYLCGTGDSPMVVPNPECPNADQHTPHPSGYEARNPGIDMELVKAERRRLTGGPDA